MAAMRKRKNSIFCVFKQPRTMLRECVSLTRMEWKYLIGKGSGSRGLLAWMENSCHHAREVKCKFCGFPTSPTAVPYSTVPAPKSHNHFSDRLGECHKMGWVPLLQHLVGQGSHFAKYGKNKWNGINSGGIYFPHMMMMMNAIKKH